MAKLTKSGIAYNLEDSPHMLEMKYENESLTYIFSSKLYKDIFLRKQQNSREKLSISLSKRFGFTIEHDILADLKLYEATEKRGFLIKGKEESYSCLERVKLSGIRLIIKN